MFLKTRVSRVKHGVFRKRVFLKTRVSRVFNEVRFSPSAIVMEDNTLGEWSDGDDSWIFDVDENSLWDWSDSEDDEIIRGIQESNQTGRGEKRKSDETLLPEEDF